MSTTSAAADRGIHRVEHLMGTAISIDLPDSTVPSTVLDAVFAYLRDIDERFSTYKANSEISRLGRGELTEADVSPDVRFVLALCDDLSRTSGGYFDARRHRGDGLVDPSGLVKGWSIEGAALILDAAGADAYSINAGGDVVVKGCARPGEAWRIGIQHPRRHDRVAGVLALRDAAVATSGMYERGEHIFDPHTGRPPVGMLSLSVVGPSLTFADAYATAGFAMGVDGIAWVVSHPGYGAYGITNDDRVLRSANLDRLIV